MWLPNDRSDAPKKNSGKGKRLIVLHAGRRSEGLIDGCDLVFLAEDTVCSNFSQKKTVLQNYLTQHNIPFSATDTKKSII
jgi:hypothetical protein